MHFALCAISFFSIIFETKRFIFVYHRAHHNLKQSLQIKSTMDNGHFFLEECPHVICNVLPVPKLTGNMPYDQHERNTVLEIYGEIIVNEISE